MYEYQCGEFGCGYWGFKGEYFFFFSGQLCSNRGFSGATGLSSCSSTVVAH